MTKLPDDDELHLAIKRISTIEDDENVILNKKEARDIRKVIAIYRKSVLMKTFIGYFVAFVAAYAAFKANLVEFFGGGK